MIRYALVTIAIGPKYRKYAETLFYSFILHNSKNEIKFIVISDEKIYIKKVSDQKFENIVLNNLLLGYDIFLNKFNVIEEVNSQNILLIDADSLICGNIEAIFYKYRYRDIVIWGEELKTNDYWRNIDIKKLAVKKLKPAYRINGGLYFFKKNTFTNDFFNHCKNLLLNYENNEFEYIYGEFKDDEIIFSCAFSNFNLKAEPYNTEIKAETMYFTRRYINIFSGTSKLFFKNCEYNLDTILMRNISYPFLVCFDRNSVKDFDYIITSIFLQHFFYAGFTIRLFIGILSTILLRVNYYLIIAKKNLLNIKRTGK